MTIEEILAATIRKTVLGREFPHNGTVNGFLWIAAKAIQSKDVTELKRAYRLLLKYRSDGSLVVLPTVEQTEMIDFVAAELEKFRTGEVSAIRRRERNLTESALSYEAIENKKLRFQNAELLARVNDLTSQVAVLTEKLSLVQELEH
jgi:hypothetical protein